MYKAFWIRVYTYKPGNQYTYSLKCQNYAKYYININRINYYYTYASYYMYKK